MKKAIKEWAMAAGVRAVKTMAQTAIAVIAVFAASAAIAGYPVMADINWAIVASASLLSGILSVLTSLAGVPEVSDGDSVASLND